MRRITKVAIAATVLFATAAAASADVSNPAAAGPPPGAAGKGGPAVIKVGAASRSVLPTIDGSHDYLAAVNPDPTDPLSPGLFVPEWDQGRVAVGNGDSESHWVHDDMEVTAVAFQPQGSKKITVVVAANLYMIFGADADVIRERVADLVGPEVAGRLEIAISTDHNHHGPDTAFDINHEWYELMIDQSAAAIDEAIDELRPARLDVAETDHYFGLRDSRDPQVIDPTLGVLRATATNGETIATMLFWGNHPEVTLGWDPPADNIADDCAQIDLQPCTIEDRYFTADFPGWATRIVEDAARWRGRLLQRRRRQSDHAAGRQRVGGRRGCTARARSRAAPWSAAGHRCDHVPGQELPPRLSDRPRAGRGCSGGAGGRRGADRRTERRLRRRPVLHAYVEHRVPPARRSRR